MSTNKLTTLTRFNSWCKIDVKYFSFLHSMGKRLFRFVQVLKYNWSETVCNVICWSTPSSEIEYCFLLKWLGIWNKAIVTSLFSFYFNFRLPINSEFWHSKESYFNRQTFYVLSLTNDKVLIKSTSRTFSVKMLKNAIIMFFKTLLNASL